MVLVTADQVFLLLPIHNLMSGLNLGQGSFHCFRACHLDDHTGDDFNQSIILMMIGEVMNE